MLRGFTTITFFADDLPAAQSWYTELLGTAPYFSRSAGDTPAYIEFRLGDYQHELGILNTRFAPHPPSPHPAGVVAYWAVDDLQSTYDHLLTLGATPHDPPTERGPGFTTASVTDPFGNILGIMFNKHYLEVLNGLDRS